MDLSNTPDQPLELPALPEIDENVLGAVSFNFSGIIAITTDYSLDDAKGDLRDILAMFKLCGAILHREDFSVSDSLKIEKL